MRDSSRPHDVGLQLLDFSTHEQIELLGLTLRGVLCLHLAGKVRGDLIESRGQLLQQVLEF